ncbi:MAG: sugar ABC transporter permease [Planctomycetes bacterium]|nr:sugar ABC transporter permease [Planctomycetota bacterium]
MPKNRIMQDELIFIPPPKRHTDPWAYVFAAPALALLAAFLFIPAVWVILTSFGAESSEAGAGTGFSAYIHQLKSRVFWRTILNTAYFGGVYVPGTLIVGYVLARLIFRKIRSRRWLVLLFFVPCLIPTAAAGPVWHWLCAPDAGLLNRALTLAGSGPVDWFHSPKLALPSIAVMCIWQSAGLITAIFLAGMWAVPRECGEMADLDGARGLRRLWHVTLPSVQDALRISLLLLLINSVRVFGAIFVVTRDGGPANWSTTLPFLVYREGMKVVKFDGACALSTLLCFGIAIMVVLLRRFPMKRGQSI